jgi:hypothetical protein
MPWQDACGPLSVPDALPRFLAAVTCRPWPGDVRAAMTSSRGKLLLDLIETLGGKAVSAKVGAPHAAVVVKCARQARAPHL